MNNLWRTMTPSEWVYLIESRPGVRYAKAIVNGVNGLIILPDAWDINTYTLYNTNQANASFNSNTISVSAWSTILESNGAVFLPCSGVREDGSVLGVLSQGFYWSSNQYNNNCAAYLLFHDTIVGPYYYHNRHHGRSVRLVRSMQ